VTSTFGLVVRFTLRDEDATSAFDALVAQTIDGIKAHEPGTLAYLVHTVEGEPRVRIFYELYVDRAAFEQHEEQPHTRHFLAEREQHLANVEVTFLHAQVGTGLVGL
jgi:quinol monooxygenase YgiN